MSTLRDKAINMLDIIRKTLNDSEILEELVYNSLSSDEAIENLEHIARHHEIDLDRKEE